MEQPNLSYIKSMSGGDEAFENKLLQIIKSEFPIEKDVYYRSLEEKNYKLIAEHVHKLKHKISILGLEKSYELAVTYEANLLENSTKGQEDFEMILQTITNYLQDL